MTSPVYRLGTRKSALATTQSNTILGLLKSHGIASSLVLIESEGDKNRKTPLYEIEAPTPGLFTKQLEQALLDGQIDIAVHSLKDLPTQQPPGLVVACQPKRVVATDCLVIAPSAHQVRPGLPLREGARVGTSSLRREAELLSIRPDLEVVPIRGNVPTRVDAAKTGKVDAVVLAEAGLFRLGVSLGDLIKLSLPTENFVPAPGQGALAVEVRSDAPAELLAALKKFHDADTETETRIERKILRELEGGCTLPLGVRCTKDGDSLALGAFLGLMVDGRGGRHEWTAFHRFELSGANEEWLVQETVRYFKGFLK